MKNKITLLLLLILNLNAFSQTRKFSIDINYPLALNKNETSDSRGIIDASIKYRFKELDIISIGAAYTYDFAKEEIGPSDASLKNNYHFHHLDGLVEFKLKSVEKLHPFAQIGYTLLTTKSEVTYSGPSDPSFGNASEVSNNSGINLGVGATYDIADRFFVQLYYHYIKVYSKNDFNNEVSGYNYDQLKLGAGFRF